MKQLLILLLISLTLVSCDRRSPEFGSDLQQHAFIVQSIDRTNSCSYFQGKNYCIYKSGHGYEQGASVIYAYPAVICECGLYQIGDTIKLDRQ